MTRPLAFAVLALACLTGCATDARTRYAEASQAYTAASRALQAAVDADLVKDVPTLKALKATDATAASALERAGERIKAGQAIDANYWIDEMYAALARLVALQKQAAKEKVSWTPQPFSPSLSAQCKSPNASRNSPNVGRLMAS